MVKLFWSEVIVDGFTVAVFEEPEDPTNRSFFSEIISSISDVKFSHNGRYLITRDYLSVKVRFFLQYVRFIHHIS